MFTSESHAVAAAMDKINDKYGGFVQYASTDETIIDGITFGGVTEMEELYQQ